MSVEVRHISKSFGNFNALKDVSLRIETGELVSLLGPSGSGKTTLLRIIAGMDTPDTNEQSKIMLFDEDVSAMPIGQRRVGFVFQHYALFKHMTVFENIAFGLRVRPRAHRPNRHEISDRVGELLKLIQLDGLGGRFPMQLSGGQRQRVALARALAIEPKVLLLDEPFGALDAKVRQSLRKWLRDLQSQLRTTTVLVTHDQEEALEVSDRVVVMNQARIEQVDTPENVFHNPASEFVIDFLGNVNVFHGRLNNEGRALLAQPTFESGDSSATESGSKVYVRPHEMRIERTSHSSDSIVCQVDRIHLAGAFARVFLRSADRMEVRVDLTMEKLHELQLQKGEDVFVRPTQSRVFEADYSI